jgi:hypothetical protein
VRTIEINGGLDSFLMSVNDSKLSHKAILLKRRIEKTSVSRA